MDKLQAAQLQVVLPGSRASFRRRVVDAISSLVPAWASFCFLGREDARAYTDATHVVAGVARPLAALHTPRLSDAFGFDAKSVVAGSRRVYVATELWPETERRALPFFRDTASLGQVGSALLLFLHEGGVLFGLAGLERGPAEPPFGDDEQHAIDAVAPFIIAGARAQLQYDALAREASALRALGRSSGAVYVVDRDRRAVVFAADRERGLDWDEDVAPIEDQLVDGAEQLLAARDRGDALPTPPRLVCGTVASVVRLEGDPVFGGARCAAVRVETAETPALLDRLSRRERDIARLLIAGYSGVNIAAISGLSENTVRTYVRRLYTKLGANNRADLVRKLITPEPRSHELSHGLAVPDPHSPVAPPPDSSLVAGDDTLD